MKRLFNCHYKYLMTKTNMLSVLIVIGIIIGGYLISIDESNNIFIVHEYFYQSFFITKLLVILIIVFISSYNFIQKNDQYSYLVLTSGYKKYQYITSKIILLIILFGSLIGILLIVFLFCGVILINSFTVDSKYLLMYLKLYLIAIIYSLYSMLLTQMTNSIFSSIIVFTLMMISDMIIEDQRTVFSKGIFLLLPNISFGQNHLFFGYSHLIVLIILLALLNIIFYQKKDLA